MVLSSSFIDSLSLLICFGFYISEEDLALELVCLAQLLRKNDHDEMMTAQEWDGQGKGP